MTNQAISQYSDIHSSEIDEEHKVLNKRIDSLILYDLNSSLDFCSRKLKDIEFYRNPGVYCKLLSTIGFSAFHLGDINLSDSIYKTLINISKNNLHPLIRADILLYVQRLSATYGKNIEALSAIKEAYAIYQQNGFIDGQLKLLGVMLNINMNMGNTKLALEYYNKMMPLLSYSQNNMVITALYRVATNFEMSSGNYNLALEHLLKAKKIAQLTKNEIIIGKSVYLHGLFYFNQGNYTKADEYFDEAIDHFILANDNFYYSRLVTLKASIQMKHKKFEEAIYLNKLALSIRQDLGSQYFSASSYLNIANSFIQIQQYDSANLYIENGKKIYSVYPFKANQIRVHELQQKIYIQNKDYKSAYLALENVIHIQDSLYLVGNKQKIDELETDIELGKYEQQKKEIRTETVIQKNLKDNNLILIRIILIVLVLVIISSYIIYLYSKLKNKKKLILISQKMIFIQMNSHFVFNALTAIQSLIYKSQIETAIQSLTVFSSLINKILSITHERYISLQTEVSFIMEFLQTQKLRFGDDLNYIVNISPELDLMTEMVPPMLIYPYLEYAAEECLRKTEEDSSIEINIFKKKKYIVCQLIDIGLGFSDEGKCYIKRYGGQEVACDQLTQERFSLYNNMFVTKLIFARSRIERNGQMYNVLEFKFKM